jgi:PIN domain nuclease of toxin-antitoxin system
MLWLGSRPDLLSQKAAEAIASSRKVMVSPMSLYELLWKQQIGKLRLPMPAAQWYDELIEDKQLTEIAVTGSIAGRAAALPMIHRDPADRFLIATAMENGLRLITPDPEIKKYPGVRVVW